MINSFEGLVNDVIKTEKNPKDYLTDFFVKSNFKNYNTDSGLDKNELKAVKIMFESKKDIKKRAESALEYDSLCLEAFFTYFVLSEDIYVYYSFRDYFSEADKFADLNLRQKHNYLRILDFYVDFLLDIHNITEAIKVQRTIMRLGNDDSVNAVNRLSYMYSLIEDDEEFYRHYLAYDFNDYDYLTLIVTLLKHENEIKAKEVLLDMFDKNEYTLYLDHIWDLDQKGSKQKQFYQLVDSMYGQLSSVLDFFGWVSKIKENR